MIPTLNHRLTEAAVCQANGWGPGTYLAGDEGYGVTIIKITAVGEDGLLARMVAHDGKPRAGRENSWVLWCREWREVPESEVPVDPERAAP